MPPIGELFHEWHDFYMLAGAASATLVGLMFVAASIGASVFNEEHRAPMHAFFTPTVVHFASVLLLSLLITVPVHNWLSLGVLMGAGGVFGSIYCGGILVQVIVRRQFKVDVVDRMFYALIPVLGYLAVSAAAVLIVLRSPLSVDVIAVAVMTLLVAGIRNAWDMLVFLATRSRDPT
jgi:hypothetical protein